MSDFEKTYIGVNATGFETSPEFLPYSKVIVWYDDENAFVAGDDSGRTMEVDLPFATQEIADNMLARIKGYVYRPYEATGALLDPAAELGDAVTINGVYSLVADVTTDFNCLGAADVLAPSEEEIDHEFPFKTPLERTLARKVTLGASYHGVEITRANGLEISWVKADGTVGGNRAVLNSKVFALYDDDGNEALYFDSVARKYRFMGDVHITGGTMNINDNFIVDELGNVTINGNLNIARGSLYWGSNFPYVSQFSDSASGPWHTEQTTDDIYRRDSWDGGKTWGTPYQFVGKDGVDGSDARVPSYIKSTYIDETTIRSPVIEANEFNVYPNDEEDYTGSFNIYGMQLGSQYHMLAIAYQGYDGAVTPYVDVYSPDGADLRFNYGNQGISPIRFFGTVDFTQATVTGLSVAGASVDRVYGEDPYVWGESTLELIGENQVSIESDGDVVTSAGPVVVRYDAENEWINFWFANSQVGWRLSPDGLEKVTA